MSYFYSQEHQIKNKYTGKWNRRSVHVEIKDSHQNLKISNKSGKQLKNFPLDEVRFLETDKNKVILGLGNKRQYHLAGNNASKLVQAINQHKLIQKIQQEQSTLPIMLPQTINYGAIYSSPNTVGTLSEPNKDVSEQPQQSKIDYPRQKSYLLQRDWEINKERGGLTLISQQKKKNQTKILKFVLKKFINNGSFMGISFPVFAMKPQSILETYGKSIGAAPILFQNISKDPLQRIKHFVSFIFSFSRLFSDMDKPFNPVIGQTFQGKIAGRPYSAEQTSHHPPQSSFYYQGKGYRIYSTIQLVAKIGVNDADGLFQGDIHIQFDDGGHIFGRNLAGNMSGFIIGQNKFRPQGSSYAYDPINKLVCTFKRDKKDVFIGHIGTLKNKYQQRFEKTLKSQDRFGKGFDACQQKHFEMILSKMQAKWSKNVTFNMKTYINFTMPQYLPFQLTKDVDNLLLSDSSFRKDIKLRVQNLIDQSQQQKQRIQEEQRAFRKLREKMGAHKK